MTLDEYEEYRRNCIDVSGMRLNTANRLERTKPMFNDLHTKESWVWLRNLEARRCYHESYCFANGDVPEAGGIWAKIYSY